MVLAGNKAKCLSSINHTTKPIYHNHHHHHHHHHHYLHQNDTDKNKTLELTIFDYLICQVLISLCSHVSYQAIAAILRAL